MFAAGTTILFQGDSITDVGRDRNNPEPNRALGGGYAFMIASQLLAQNPRSGFKIYNRGISGNRVVDLYARWQEDALNLMPDLISILIGVNDTWHRFNRNAGIPLPKYERVYRQLLSETKELLPQIKFVLCEPFILRCGAVTPEWYEEIARRQEVVLKLSREFEAVRVPFQSAFDHALENGAVAPEFWAQDGVHPSAAGHRLMADTWFKAVAEKKR